MFNEHQTIKLKQDELNRITNELKSHYVYNEFFVDPDKKFTSLLEKIIVNKKLKFRNSLKKMIL